jgi:Glyoxalase-like domain
LNRGIDFYCRRLGLGLKRWLSRSWGRTLRREPADISPGEPACGREPWARTAPRIFERHWTPVHLDFIVTDLDRVVAQLTRLSGSLDRDIQVCEYGRIANMADPFGNRFDLIEFCGSGYDAVSRL